ncbi:MAG TPA: hypothetical protein V6D22_13575 [Candidatus Obscuribacterales bacterium]
MALPEAWQSPAADDIDPDSLEYLFGQKLGRGDVPWVKIVREPEPVARISPEMIRLQAKLEMLVTQLEIYAGKLTAAHHELGFARAEIAEKDKQLTLMEYYRARAAKAIASDVELEQLRMRVCELEQQLLDEMHHRYQQPTFVLKIAEPAPVAVIANEAAGSLPSGKVPSQAKLQAISTIAAQIAHAEGAPAKAPARGTEPSNHDEYLERALARHGDHGVGLSISLLPINYLLAVAVAALILLTIVV